MPLRIASIFVLPSLYFAEYYGKFNHDPDDVGFYIPKSFQMVAKRLQIGIYL